MEQWIRTITEIISTLTFCGGALLTMFRMHAKLISAIDTIELRVKSVENKVESSCDSCAKYRTACNTQIDGRFKEIKDYLREIDNKRQSDNKDISEILSDISCRLGRIDGRLERVAK